MDGHQFYRTRLPEHLDANGDLAPPWEQFPNYERYTIGWRMGGGESWLCLWCAFLESLDAAYEVRLAYLRRHPPAPVSWADRVSEVLHPAEVEEVENETQAAAQRRAELFRLGLIASDASYPIWLRQQQGVRWPWTFDENPETATRHWTRDLWFWSRQVMELRGNLGWVPPQVPETWHPCAEPLATGAVYNPELRRGLLSLAQMLSAGRVVPLWEFGLGTDDFKDSFEMDMGYADAFRLWGMKAFDDGEHLRRCLGATAIPNDWQEWISEQFHFD